MIAPRWRRGPGGRKRRAQAPKKDEDDPPRAPSKAPELDGGIAWLNTGRPLSLKDLKGKIVLLDFWTLCCINCIHILPDLAKLEKKYANELVVIGVHSAKFENEKDTERIRKAILRYEIEHPVVNDADQKIWDRYECRSVADARPDRPGGELRRPRRPARATTSCSTASSASWSTSTGRRRRSTRSRSGSTWPSSATRATRPLFFPGKVLADAKRKRLFIADSTHHRIVITDLTGNKVAVAGTGTPGTKDGAFAKAQFDDPQGMALNGDTLYVADRKNHLIRALDLKAKTVKTIAGTGEQDRRPRRGRPGAGDAG